VPDGTVFVRDGFTVLAFLVPLLWFLWHRMWIEAGLMLAVMLVLAGLDTMSSLPFLAGFASLLVSFALGLEAPALRMAALRRRGWHAWGVVEASNRREAEWRYAAEAEPDAAARAGMQSPPPQP